ncbi:MAG: DoxX family protein [Burkholderiaceae bacterium]
MTASSASTIDRTTAPYAALVLRVALGAMFVAHALLKVFVFTLPGTVQFFESLGLPGGLAYATVAAELVGGVLLIAGLGTRWIAAALIPVLLGATWVHAGNGWLFTAKGGGWEYPAFLSLVAFAVVMLGDGALSATSIVRKLSSTGASRTGALAS